MKTTIKFNLLAALIISILTVSCSSDNDKLPSSNSIKMNGESFKIIGATMIGISLGNDGHTVIGLTNSKNDVITTISMDVNSFTKETISGKYNYPENETDKVLDGWLTNYAAISGLSSTSSTLKSGSITVKYNGDDNYTVELNLTMIDETIFTGTYTGNFQVQFQNYTNN